MACYQQVENDSPIIRELNRAAQRQFISLLLFAVVLFLVLSVSLGRWGPPSVAAAGSQPETGSNT